MISQKKLGEKIKNWREQREMSQEQFAKVVDLGRVAVSEIERGNRGVSALELQKAAKFFNVSVDALLADEKATGFSEIKNDFKFDSEKLKNVILYILEKCGGKPNVGETVLYKLLYFVDFDSFEIFGKPLTGLNYVNRQFGPVPATKEYLATVEMMVKNEQLKIFPQIYFGLNQKRYIALTNHNDDAFNVKEIKIIDSVISRLADMSAKQIEEYAHGDAPWKFTEDKQIIPYDLAFDRASPYAQVDHEAEWQDAAGSDTLKHLGKQSKEEYDYYKNL